MPAPPLTCTDSELRTLRALAHNPGMTPEEVALKAFHGRNLYSMTGNISRTLRQMHERRLLKRGYAFIHTGKSKHSWTANYTYFVSREGYEVLQSDEYWNRR